MSRVHRRGVIAGTRSSAKTYAEFDAYITVLAANGDRPWSGIISSTLGNKTHTTVAGAETGTMVGTPWGPADAFSGSFHAGSIVCRVVQHAMPSYAAFVALSGTKLFLRLIDTGVNGVVNAVDRNSYLSTSGPAGSRRFRITEVLYWDGTQAQQMNPSAGTGPTPYTW